MRTAEAWLQAWNEQVCSHIDGAAEADECDRCMMTFFEAVREEALEAAADRVAMLVPLRKMWSGSDLARLAETIRQLPGDAP